jgi:DNA-damage-inducible protein J
MSMTNINIRTDSEIKSQAQDIFNSLGLDMTTMMCQLKHCKNTG